MRATDEAKEDTTTPDDDTTPTHANNANISGLFAPAFAMTRGKALADFITDALNATRELLKVRPWSKFNLL